MKLDHLTFGQLYKLAHPWNFMRMDSSRYAAMNRARVASGEQFAPPAIAARYNKVLDFMRGPELKAALKKAAAEQEIPYVPGASQTLFCVPKRRPEIMRAHQNIIYTFCKLAGAVPKVVDDCVVVDTTPLGIEALRYRPGLKWKTILQECAIENLRDPKDIFWWCNLIEPLRDDDRVNPAVWPCNTPDVVELAERLVTRADSEYAYLAKWAKALK